MRPSPCTTSSARCSSGAVPRAAKVLEEAESDALAYLDPPLEAPQNQQRAGEDEPRDKAQIVSSAGIPAGEVARAIRATAMCEQEEAQSSSRYFEARMRKLGDGKGRA